MFYWEVLVAKFVQPQYESQDEDCQAECEVEDLQRVTHVNVLDMVDTIIFTPYRTKYRIDTSPSHHNPRLEFHKQITGSQAGYALSLPEAYNAFPDSM